MPRIYLSTGRDGPERKIRKNVLHLARWLERQQIAVTVSDQPGGHDMDFWSAELVAAFRWYFQLPGCAEISD